MNSTVVTQIIKCLVSKGNYCSISGGLYRVQHSKDCALALYFNDDNAIKSNCSITVKTINKNSVMQINPNHYLMSVIHSSNVECRCSGFTNSKTVKLPLALITIQEEFYIFTIDFIIPAVNSFTSKVSITLWGYQFDPYESV